MNSHIFMGIIRYTKWKEIKNSICRWFNRKRSPIGIVIFGESGVGKTQFLNTILNNGIISETRTMDIDRKTLYLPNGRRLKFYDTPGHKSLKTARDTIKRDFHKKKIMGIINIVDYGYSSVPNQERDSVFNVDSHEVKAKFLEDNRKRQLNQIAEWQDLINAQNNVKWCLTLVNKADIWYSNREEVLGYYTDGEYADALKGMERCCNIVAFPFCSIISPFMGEPMLLTMSEKDKMLMHKDLFNEIQKLSIDEE